jgi:hypothetical protein
LKLKLGYNKQPLSHRRSWPFALAKHFYGADPVLSLLSSS